MIIHLYHTFKGVLSVGIRIRVFIAISGGLMCLPLLSAAAGGEPVNLTEEQAVRLFYERNLDLLAARYNIENYQAQEIIAAAIPNPTVSFEMLELSKNSNQNSSATGCPSSLGVKGNANCGPAEYFTFTQLIEMAGHRGLRMQSSAIATQAAESDFRDAVRIFTGMVRNAYYALLQAQKIRWLAQETVNHYQDIVRDNQLRLQAGAIAESDFLRIDVEALQAQSELEVAQAAVEQAQGNLAVMLNWPDKSMQFTADDKWPQLREIGQNQSREALINQALSRRPDLLADKQRADQAEKDLAKARSLIYPDVTINGGFARDPSNTVLDTGFVGISVPLPLFYQYKGEASQAAANLSQMRLAAEQTELAVRSDVVKSLASWKSADNVLKIYESKLLEQVRAVRDRSELAYNRGATTVLDLIDVQRNYKTVMLNYYTAMINKINAYYDLSRSMGVEPDEAYGRQMDEPAKIDGGRLRDID
ncbi:MAG: TolC family protein [Methylococcales bacterium]|nr:TolC family protein [Methylococcales bacterium]